MGWHLLDNMKAFAFISEIAFIVYYVELGMAFEKKKKSHMAKNLQIGQICLPIGKYFYFVYMYYYLLIFHISWWNCAL